MRNGIAYRRPASAPPTRETESSSWPTPRAIDGRSAGPGTSDATLLRRSASGFGLNLPEAVQMTERKLWPTPNTIGFRSDGELKLLPEKCETREEYEAMSDRACRSKRERYWPTPTVSMTNGSSLRSMTRTTGASRENDRLDYAVERGEISRGRLNPQWVEALMGFPPGWTVIAK
jgi:hypothetical protein